MSGRRSYSMTTRSRQAEATRERILGAARELFDLRASGFTLDEVADAAGTSVQTVLRAYGNKQSLIVAAIGTFRARPELFAVPGSDMEAVGQLFDDYEQIGDRVVLLLAEEARVPDFADVAEHGRSQHRRWVKASFAADIRRHPARRRATVTTALIAATDVYVWKLLRRDLGLDRAAAESVVLRLVRGAVADQLPGGTT